MNNSNLFKNEENKKFVSKVIIICFFIIGGAFLYSISNIVLILLFSCFLSIVFSPFLNKMNKWKICDGLGIFIIYFIIFIFLCITIFSIIPIFAKQLLILFNMSYDYINNILFIYNDQGIQGFNFPHFINKIILNINFNEILISLKDNIGTISSFLTTNLKYFLNNGFGFLSNITSMVINLFLTLIFTIFIVLERENVKNFFYNLLPADYSKYIKSKEKNINNTLYNWLKGQFLLCLSIFVLTLIGLIFLKLFGIHIDKIFTLALIAGIMEFVPYLGIILAILPAIAIAFGISFWAVIAIIILYTTIQLIESYVLNPLILGKTLSVSPLLVFLFMMVGGSLFGIIGIIISIPLVGIIQIFFTDFLNEKNNSIIKKGINFINKKRVK